MAGIHPNLNLDVASLQVTGGGLPPRGTFDDPYVVGQLQLWDDPDEDVLRTKRGGAPEQLDDGRIIEPAQPGGSMY